MKLRRLLLRAAQIAFLVGILGALLGFTNFNLVQGAIKKPLLAVGLAVAYLCYTLERLLSLLPEPQPAGDRKSRRKAARAAPPPEARLRPPWFFWAALAAYFAWYAVAWFGSPYPHHGLALLWRWMLYLGCFFGAGLFFPKREHRNRILVVYFAVAVLEAVYAFLQIFEIDIIRRDPFDFGVRNPFTHKVLRRVMGSLDNPGYFGGTLAACLALGAGWLLALLRERAARGLPLYFTAAAAAGIGLGLLLPFVALHTDAVVVAAAVLLVLFGVVAAGGAGYAKSGLDRGEERSLESLASAAMMLLFACCGAIALALLLSFSRSALLATFVAGFVILGGVVLRWRDQLGRLFPFPKSAGIALVAVVVLGLGAIGATQHQLVRRIAERFTGTGRLGAVTSHELMYRANLEMIAGNPVLGVGPGNYFSFFRDYRDTEFGNLENPSRKVNEFAHSEFMQQAIELGLPGLLFYLLLVGMPLGVALKRLWRGPPGPDDLLLLCVSAAVLAGLAANAFDVLLQQISYGSLFWTLLGWIAATLWVETAPAPRRLPRLAWLLVLPVAFWGTQAIARDYLADVLTYRAQVTVSPIDGSAPDPVRALQLAERAVQIAPHYRRASYFLGTLDYSTEQYRKAADVYERLLAQEGRFADVVYNLGTFHYFLKEYSRAAELYRQAIEDFPNKADYHFQLARTLWALDKHDEARQAYQDAVKIYEKRRPFPPNRLDQYDHLATCYLRLNQTENAAKAYQAKLRSEPPPASDTHYWLGVVQLSLEHYPAAVKNLEVAEQHPPRQVGIWQVHHHLGQAYMGVGNAGKAREQLEAALRTMPANYSGAAQVRQLYAAVLHTTPAPH